jgi:hypothetical protein
VWGLHSTTGNKTTGNRTDHRWMRFGAEAVALGVERMALVLCAHSKKKQELRVQRTEYRRQKKTEDRRGRSLVMR